LRCLLPYAPSRTAPGKVPHRAHSLPLSSYRRLPGGTPDPTSSRATPRDMLARPCGRRVPIPLAARRLPVYRIRATTVGRAHTHTALHR